MRTGKPIDLAEMSKEDLERLVEDEDYYQLDLGLHTTNPPFKIEFGATYFFRTPKTLLCLYETTTNSLASALTLQHLG